MLNTIQFGDDIRIGAYTFPDRKKPYIAIHDLKTNSIHGFGQFYNEEYATEFMNILSKYIGAEQGVCGNEPKID